MKLTNLVLRSVEGEEFELDSGTRFMEIISVRLFV